MKQVVIMGAGPAGLAAGHRLVQNGIDVSLVEADFQVGGLSKTINYQGFYFDLGGHRFFTKIKEVDSFWHETLKGAFIKTPRLSRIYYRNKFFNYPITPLNAFKGLGLINTASILSSYFYSKLFPYPTEETFEQWVSNRFGKKLYQTFFKTYTEKVWGIPCESIQAEWASQRIKDLSLRTAIMNALFKPSKIKIKTLINEFTYPTHGPGMMYNKVKKLIENSSGTVFLNSRICKVNHQNFKVLNIESQNFASDYETHEGTDFISSIPITDLIKMLNPPPPKNVLEAAYSLHYRSFITVGIIVNKKELFPDNWIYVHSPEVKLGRIQNFKNWSPFMSPDSNKTSLGLEYFCDEDDDFWNLSDQELFEIAAKEIEIINICKKNDIETFIIVRVPKAYPVYSMGYQDHLKILKNYLCNFSNLQLAGRYGLFKYNNMDHSILTGFYAAQNIIEGQLKYNTWTVNTEGEYHEIDK